MDSQTALKESKVDELLGWKSILRECDGSVMETRMFLQQDHREDSYFRARLDARQCARDAVAGRIEAMELERR